MKSRSILAMLVFSLLFSLSPLAADPMIQRGIDVFTTLADGKTYYDFAFNPIPAGFFCKDSKPFTDRVAFKGLPLATGTPGELGAADTIIERLDDAVFNTQGVGVTRLQFRALSLVSIAPVQTACGSFHLYVSLGGKQRVTTMNILRTQEDGGNFVAPLAVDVRMTFIPVKAARDKAARNLEFMGSFTFPATPMPWSLRKIAMAKGRRPVVVDTNGDLVPDTRLPGTSNFAPGRSSDRLSPNKSRDGECPACATIICHESDGCQHCYSDYPWWCAEPPIC